MREIKFRYVFEVGIDKHIEIVYFSLDELENDSHKFYFKEQKHIKIISRDLFTGLKDKNGKEIYEGDIIRYISIINEAWNIYNFKPIFEIKFEQGAFGIDDIDRDKEIEFYPLYDTDTCQDVEVIGNIYENSELIKGEIR